MHPTNEVWVEDSLKREVIKKKWGEEMVVVNNPLYCGKILHIFPGGVSSTHYHPKKTETFLATCGVVAVEVWDSVEDAKEGKAESDFIILRGVFQDALHIPPNTPHRFRAIDDEAFVVEFSTTHEDSDTVRITESYYLAPEDEMEDE